MREQDEACINHGYKPTKNTWGTQNTTQRAPGVGDRGGRRWGGGVQSHQELVFFKWTSKFLKLTHLNEA